MIEKEMQEIIEKTISEYNKMSWSTEAVSLHLDGIKKVIGIALKLAEEQFKKKNE